MLGLAQAARSWDPDRGASFEHHATTRIRGALLDELRGADWASRSVRSKARRMLRARDDLTLRLGRTPTTAEVAAQLGTDATYHAAIGARSDFRARLDAAPRPLLERVAASA
jgi:RNA polymerase sigma factor for flagellar operon FliA